MSQVSSTAGCVAFGHSRPRPSSGGCGTRPLFAVGWPVSAYARDRGLRRMDRRGAQAKTTRLMPSITCVGVDAQGCDRALVAAAGAMGGCGVRAPGEPAQGNPLAGRVSVPRCPGAPVVLPSRPCSYSITGSPPSSIVTAWWAGANPTASGHQDETDRRDATTLAALHRAGELKAVWVPMRPARRCGI
jgi:hypothetical protein